MSLKHIKKYYNDLKKQKEEMDAVYGQFLETADKEAVDPQIIENIKVMSESVTSSFDAVRYIMYLFNLPNNPKKMHNHEKNTKKEKNSLNPSYSPEAIKAENQATINSAKSQI